MKRSPTAPSEKKNKLLIKRCHLCGSVIESYEEAKKCTHCQKSFLPSNYFGKIHANNTESFHNLFLTSDEIHEEDLIKGIAVLW